MKYSRHNHYAAYYVLADHVAELTITGALNFVDDLAAEARIASTTKLEKRLPKLTSEEREFILIEVARNLLHSAEGCLEVHSAKLAAAE